jgi:esterase FrsA
MSKLHEAKQFVGLHARHMGFAPTLIGDVLGRVNTLDGDSAGSWVGEWSVEAKAAADRGDHLTAANLYNLARFPAADSEAKRVAGQACSESFMTWMNATGVGERRKINVGSSSLTILFSKGKRKNAPLVILMGGIVSLKEQWGGFLKLGSKIGAAVAIADFPGMGENTLAYDRSAAALYGAIMAAVQHDCDISRTLIIAPSFGGHLAVLHSLKDPRVQGIVTIGAPLRAFFTETSTKAGFDGISVFYV